MSSKVKEVWMPKPMTASGAITSRQGKIGGFLCTSSTSGTVQISAGEDGSGDDIVAEMSVTAGTYYPMPFYCADGAYAVLTNCAGTFQV